VHAFFLFTAVLVALFAFTSCDNVVRDTLAGTPYLGYGYAVEFGTNNMLPPSI